MDGIKQAGICMGFYRKNGIRKDFAIRANDEGLERGEFGWENYWI